MTPELLSGEAIRARVAALEEGVLELEMRRANVVEMVNAARDAGETATAELLREVLSKLDARVRAWR